MRPSRSVTYHDVPAFCTLVDEALWRERARATSDTDNNTLYTINTLHDKRTPHATATLPPQDLSKSEEEPRRSRTDTNI